LAWAKEAPGAAMVRHAKGFTLEYRHGCKILTVLSPWRNAKVTFTYVLVPKGQTAPEAPPGAIVVPIPLRTVAATTITNLPFFAALGVEDRLVGLSGMERVSTPSVVERIHSGKVLEIGTGATGMARAMNMEQLHMLAPDAVVVNASGIPELDKHPKLMEAGFVTIVDAAHMEPTPLARLEWILYLSAFFDKEAEAKAYFDSIEAQYEAMASRVRDVSQRPTALTGSAYKGMFYVAGGDSYMARFLADAGADYIWKDDDSRGSLPLSQEVVFHRARDADFWLQPGPYRSLTELEGVDDRTDLLRAVQQQQVFNNDARLTPSRANDFWEMGFSRPDMILADLIAIFHPELLPEHKLYWFRRMPVREEAKP
jgi:iron complex transport system substrate-binding protein